MGITSSCFKSNNSSPPSPTPISSIEGDELTALFSSAHSSANIILSDAKYELYTKEAIIKFLNYNLTNNRTYITEGHDCDDFAKILLGDYTKWASSNKTQKASTFGIAYGIINNISHAVNLFVDSEKKIWFVEPQSDRIFTLTDNDRITFIYL